jgi:hypothetical protein
MAVALLFTPASMDRRRYDEVIRRLEQAGAGAPSGRLYHACHGTGDQLRVFDVWDSRESFDQFGRTLMPILQQVGIDPGQPEVAEVHNIIVGDVTSPTAGMSR